MTIALRAARPATMPTVAHFRNFGYAFSVETRSSSAIEFLRRLYDPFTDGNASAGPVAPTFCLTVRSKGRGLSWEVSLEGDPLCSARSLGAALNHLEYEICSRIIAARPASLVLHGATILTDRGAAFISGPSGAGKTTLSLALAARGYRLGGDDIALLDPRTNTVRPMPRCFHLDARSRRLLRDLGATLPPESVRHAFMTPADLGTTDHTASAVRWAIYLEPGDGPRPRLAPLSQAEAVVRLLSETARGTYSTAEVIEALGALVLASDCRHLLRGRLSDTADTIASLLEPS
jgi:hypothetical protein